MVADFSHLSANNRGTMVDVAGKVDTNRIAIVTGRVQLGDLCTSKLTPAVITEVTSVSRVAGIMAAKQTANLIPFCHPLSLNKVEIDCRLAGTQFIIECQAQTVGKTGVEMEALIGAQIAASTVYDMIKAVAPEAEIGPFHVVSKMGGKSGHWTREEGQ